MDDFQIEIMAIGEILSSAVLRLSSSKVAEFILSAGRTYGKLLSPEKSFDVLVSFPVEFRDSILAETGSFVKYKRALDDNDKNVFLSLCEEDQDVSKLLYACGYLSEYSNAARTLIAPEENPFEEDKVIKNAYAVGNNESISSNVDLLRSLIKRIPNIDPYLTSDEQDELGLHLIKFRPNKEYYTVILEEYIQYNRELQKLRENAIKEYGEDEIERQFISEHLEHKWHLPSELENCKNYKSFFKIMPENTREAIYTNIHGFEALIENIATCGLIEDTEIAKNTLSQILLGKDLGCSENIPLSFREPYILCYMIAKIYNRRGYAGLKSYFRWTTLNDNNKPFDTDKQCVSYANACDGDYRDIVDDFFPDKDFPYPDYAK